MPIRTDSRVPVMTRVVLDRTLREAIGKRDLMSMREAMRLGANLYALDDGVPIWFYCTQMATPGMLNLFLEAGIDPNVTRTDRMHKGMTFLHAVAYQGDLDEFDQAMKQGGDPHRRDDQGRGVVSHAAFNGKPDLLARAIEVAPEQVNPPCLRKTEDGLPIHGRWTPLQIAAARTIDRSGQGVTLLLAAGADPTVRDDTGQGVMDLARINENWPALAVLEQHALRGTLAIESPDGDGSLRYRARL